MLLAEPAGDALIVQSAAGGWLVLRASDGRLLAEGILPGITKLNAAYARQGALLMTGAAESGDENDGVVLACVDLLQGAVAWQTRIETRIPINVSQLAAHAELIPLLILRSTAERDGVDPQSLALQFIDRRDGAVRETTPLVGFFSERTAGGIALLATPARILVQHQQSVTAFGASLVREP